MDDHDPPSSTRKSQSGPGRTAPTADPREARLAKALRDNLRRRKQARAPGGTDATAEPDPTLTPLADD